MKLTVLAVSLALACAFTSAEARPKHATQRLDPLSQRSVGCSDAVMKPCGATNSREKYSRKYSKTRVLLGFRGHRGDVRPRAWCGWQMRQWLGVRNPAGNLARWWAGFGSRAHGPAIGTIVVWRHHVGKIVGRASSGQWIVRSGNDGNRVRTRPRSVSNAIAFRWPS